MERNEIEIYSNIEVLNSNNSFNEFINQWILYLDLKESSEYTYKICLKIFFEYLIENNITNPSKADVLNYKKHLEQKEMKPQTIQLYLVVLKQFFKYLEEEHLYSNITQKIKGIKDNADFNRDNLTNDQARKLLESIERETLKGKRDYAIILLMLTTGLRTIEVVRANIGDMRTLGERTVLYIQGKGRNTKDDFVKLSAQVVEAIQEYLTERKEKRQKSPLFASVSNKSKGKRIFVKSLSRLISNHLESAGLKNDRITAHSLRHTAATLNLLNGGTIDSTKQFLRHSSINTTLKYAHHLEKIKNDSNERITELLLN